MLVLLFIILYQFVIPQDFRMFYCVYQYIIYQIAAAQVNYEQAKKTLLLVGD